MTDDVLIVGAGVIGISIAERLAAEGLRIRVLDGQGVGNGASGAAAGMLAPISEASGPSLLARAGLESLSRFDGLCARLKDETGIDPELTSSGILRVVMSDEERARIGIARAGLADLIAVHGGESEWVDAPEVKTLTSGLSPSVVGGFYSSLECHLRPPLLVKALEASARSRGVVFETTVAGMGLRRDASGQVEGVETSSGFRAAGRVVAATGAWTSGLLESSGIQLGGASIVTPVRGQILSLEAPLPDSRTIVWGDGIYFVPKRDGSWIVGATEEHVGFDRRVTAAGVADLLARARAVFPSIEGATFGRAWAGLRPVSRDGLPFVGAVPHVEGLFVAAGHGRNGVLLSPVTAERLCDALLDKGSGTEADAFSPVDRWASEASRTH